MSKLIALLAVAVVSTLPIAHAQIDPYSLDSSLTDDHTVTAIEEYDETELPEVNVLSLVFQGMMAPKRYYRGFNDFLEESLQGFAEGGGSVVSESTFTGPHLFQMIVHIRKVKKGREDIFSNGTRRKANRIMKKKIDPFFSKNPNGKLVLGGHSFGAVEMQCVKDLVTERYGKDAIAASYALAPVAHQLDSDVEVIISDKDIIVRLANTLSPGKAVRGKAVKVPGLDHIRMHKSPETRQLLVEHFASALKER
jgi:hypothetical protein